MLTSWIVHLSTKNITPEGAFGSSLFWGFNWVLVLIFSVSGFIIFSSLCFIWSLSVRDPLWFYATQSAFFFKWNWIVLPTKVDFLQQLSCPKLKNCCAAKIRTMHFVWLAKSKNFKRILVKSHSTVSYWVICFIKKINLFEFLPL